MKKILNRIALGAGTIGVIVAGAAAFSAFEAHVVNVTATIENALTIPQEADGISFGTVFPEEVLHRNLDITLSASFVSEGRVDDIEYMIRQKPKCGVPVPDTDPVQYSSFPQVTEDGINFVCPVGSVQLPLLCPFLSKHELTTDGIENENDSAGIDAFHGPLTGWTMADTLSTQVLGRLVKSGGDTSDQWDIDLHAPCFAGQCAQDHVIPPNYQPPATLNHQAFGCDLWVEVTEISTNGGPTRVTVIKQVINNNGGTATTTDFSLFLDGNAVVSGVTTTTTAGTHQVSEGAHAGYDQTFGGACGSTGLVTALPGSEVTCIVINDDIQVTSTGTLTITKVLDPAEDPGKFDLQIDGVTDPDADDIGNGGSTGAQVFDAGSVHTFGEIAGTGTNLGDYVAVISGPADCADGSVTIVASTNITCTITNTKNGGILRVHKVVVNNVPGTTTTAADFQMTVDGSNVNQDTDIPVSAGNHTVGEVANPNYTVTFSAECPGGVANVPVNTTVTCTVTNTQNFGTITVTKSVINDDGGNKVVADFVLFVGSTGVTSGASNNFAPGTYNVSENGLFGYSATIGGDCDAAGDVTLVAGDNKTCTINNNDIRPSIQLVKSVVGGTAVPDDFDVSIDGSIKSSGSSTQVVANTPHVIDEEVLMPGYSFTSLMGTSFLGVSCPVALQGTITLAPGDVVTCTITNTFGD